MKRNIIISFILVAFIAALCVTIMNIDEYYFSSVDNIGITGTEQQEAMTGVNTGGQD